MVRFGFSRSIQLRSLFSAVELVLSFLLDEIRNIGDSFLLLLLLRRRFPSGWTNDRDGNLSTLDVVHTGFPGTVRVQETARTRVRFGFVRNEQKKMKK